MPYDVSRGPHKIYGVHGAQSANFKLKSSRGALTLHGVGGNVLAFKRRLLGENMSSSQLSTDRLRVNTSREFDKFFYNYRSKSNYNNSDQCL